ncbi:MAG: choice-of-anchor J domain-containing protein [Pirellulales bacterium]|nr:choice-of-anchor J domain-containing protein [Pirellulales bacterium]
MKKILFALSALALLISTASADLTEGFDSFTGLAPPDTDAVLTANGWVGALRSDPLGTSGIFSGSETVFPPHSSPGYAGMNYENTDPNGTGDISTWVMTPELILQNGDTFSFYTRAPDGTSWADALEVRLSTAGASTDVGTTATDVGVFTILLAEINTALVPDGYPQVWTECSGTITGLSGGETGRIAMRYVVPNGGGYGTNSNYIGVDTFTTSASIIPEPSTIALVGFGLLGLLIWRRHQ